MRRLRAFIESVLLFGVVFLVYEIMYYSYMFLVRYAIEQGYQWPDISSYSSFNVDEISLYYVRDHPIEYTLICWGIILTVICVTLLISRQPIRPVFQVKWLKFKNQLAMMLTGIGLVVSINGLVRFLGDVTGQQVSYLPNEVFGAYGFTYIIIIVGIVIPVFEEVFFRGLLMGRLSIAFGAVMTISLSSIIFAISHLNIAQGLFVLPVGLLSGVLVYRTKSILSGIGLHIIYNVLNIYLDKIQFFQYNSLQLLVMIAMGVTLMVFGLNQIEDYKKVHA